MKPNKKVMILALTALILVPLLAYSVLGANVIGDLFESLFGKGSDVLNIADIYDTYHGVIDPALLIAAFIAIANLTLGRQLARGQATGSSKTISVVIGSILGVAGTWWMSAQNMKLGDFGPIAITIVVAAVGFGVFRLITLASGDKDKSSAMAGAYLVTYASLQAVAPGVFGWLRGVDADGKALRDVGSLSIISTVLDILFLVSIIIVIIWVVRTVSGLVKGTRLGGLPFAGPNTTVGSATGPVAGVIGRGIGRGLVAGGRRVGQGAGVIASGVRSGADTISKAAETSRRERMMENAMIRAEVKSKKELKSMITAINSLIEDLEKGTPQLKTVQTFNKKVPRETKDLQGAFQKISETSDTLLTLEQSDLANLDAQLKTIDDMVNVVNNQGGTEQQKNKKITVLNNLTREIRDLKKQFKQPEFLEISNNLLRYTQVLRTDLQKFTEHVQAGRANVFASKFDVAKQNFTEAKNIAETMVTELDREMAVSRTLRTLERAEQRLERRINSEYRSLMNMAK